MWGQICGILSRAALWIPVSWELKVSRMKGKKNETVVSCLAHTTAPSYTKRNQPHLLKGTSNGNGLIKNRCAGLCSWDIPWRHPIASIHTSIHTVRFKNIRQYSIKLPCICTCTYIYNNNRTVQNLVTINKIRSGRQRK